MYGAFAAGWGIPAIALAIALTFSGVSFRFGGEFITVLDLEIAFDYRLILS